jgi:hypothetical protein
MRKERKAYSQDVSPEKICKLIRKEELNLTTRNP